MSIELREYLGFKPEAKASKHKEPPSITEGMFTSQNIMPDSIMVDIEGIHAGTVTRNFTRYTEQALRNSVPSWTNPYKRPLILHHNEYDGKIIGRIQAVEFVNESQRANCGSLRFTANVPASDEQEQIKDGRLDTVSIGTMVHDAKCSICGQNIATDGLCEHERGEYYDGKLCVWDVYDVEAKELSYVIVPSDEFAGTIECYAPDQSGSTKYKLSPQGGYESFSKKGVKEPVAAQTLTEQVTALTAEVSTLKEAKQTVVDEAAGLKTQLEEAKASVTELTEAKTKAEADLAEAVTAKETAEKAKVDAEQAKETAEAAVVTEKQLREQLESEHADMVVKMKESLIDSIQAMRAAAGKEALDTEKLKERSEESLRDSVADLKTEFKEKAPAAKPNPVTDPTLKDDDKKDKPGKEKNDSLKLNIREGLNGLFNLKSK